MKGAFLPFVSGVRKTVQNNILIFLKQNPNVLATVPQYNTTCK